MALTTSSQNFSTSTEVQNCASIPFAFKVLWGEQIVDAKSTIFLVSILPLSLWSCATRVQEEEGKITLQKALTDTVDAMYAAHNKSVVDAKSFGYKKGLGITACTLTAKFYIDGKHTVDGKLAIAAGPASTIPIPVTVNASTESTDALERSNTVTVVYASDACAGGVKSGG
jgi:hypothetical protein